MAVASHFENIELQDEDHTNYENDTMITASRTKIEMAAEGHYERLDLQKIDNAVYEDLQIKTKKEKDLEKILQSVIVVAVCLGMLCLMLLGGIIGLAVHYKSCPSGWKTFGESCYYKFREEKTWEESREQCLKTGADLVIINSEEERDFINGMSKRSPWIGLKRTEGKWTWVDGTPLTTQYWASGYPGNDEGWNCAYDFYKIGWNSGICSYNNTWICEK